MKIGEISFVIGMILLFVLFEFLFVIIEFDYSWFIIVPLSVALIIFGSYLLRERISVIKPLVSGSILVYFGFGAIIMGIIILIEPIDTIEISIVISILLFILGIPVAIGAICSIIRKFYKYSIIGGIISIFIGIILDPLAAVVAIAGLLLLLISEAEFDN